MKYVILVAALLTLAACGGESREERARNDLQTVLANLPTSTPTATLQSRVSLDLEYCTQESARGTVRNRGHRAVDVFIGVTFKDESGTQIGDSIDTVTNLQPGDTATFRAPFFDRGTVSTCRAFVSGVYESQ